MTGLALHDKVLRNLAAQGAAGAAWRDKLPDLVRRLESEWAIRVGDAFPNATEAYVAKAVQRDGTKVALKIPIVGLAKATREAQFLEAAKGHGYVRLLRHDALSGAMLLERLGPQLAQQGRFGEAQVEIICATLARAWMPEIPGLDLTTGAEKASQMADYFAAAWPKLGKPCSQEAVDIALQFATARAAAFDPATAVVGHGDAHAWNTLYDPATGTYKFVDPDGLFIERAQDLSISMREGSVEFLSGNVMELSLRRCALLSRLAGVDAQAIWEWSFIECLQNGLQYLETGSKEHAAPFLAVVEVWKDRKGPI